MIHPIDGSFMRYTRWIMRCSALIGAFIGAETFAESVGTELSEDVSAVFGEADSTADPSAEKSAHPSAKAHLNEGHALMGLGELEAARAAFARGLQVSSADLNPELYGRLLLGLGRVEMERQAFDQAEGHFLKAFAMRARAGEHLAALALNSLGQLEGKRGSAALARNHFTRGIDLSHRLGTEHELPELYLNLGIVERDEGRI